MFRELVVAHDAAHGLREGDVLAAIGDRKILVNAVTRQDVPCVSERWSISDMRECSVTARIHCSHNRAFLPLSPWLPCAPRPTRQTITCVCVATLLPTVYESQIAICTQLVDPRSEPTPFQKTVIVLRWNRSRVRLSQCRRCGELTILRKFVTSPMATEHQIDAQMSVHDTLRNQSQCAVCDWNGM